jgi:hypothetical protein
MFAASASLHTEAPIALARSALIHLAAAAGSKRAWPHPEKDYTRFAGAFSTGIRIRRATSPGVILLRCSIARRIA